MPARDISAIAEDMVDTLLEEGFGPDAAYGVTQRSLTVYLTLMQERVLGEFAVDGSIEAAADEAAHLVLNNVRTQRQVSSRTGRDRINASTEVEEPRVITPTRFERDPVI